MIVVAVLAYLVLGIVFALWFFVRGHRSTRSQQCRCGLVHPAALVSRRDAAVARIVDGRDPARWECGSVKRAHRRVHALAWLTLLPLLVLVIFAADQNRLPPLPAQPKLQPSELGALP